MKNNFIKKIKTAIQEERGTTLIEVLIYSAIVGFFLTGSIFFVNTLINSSKRSVANNELALNRDYVEKRISFFMGQANEISSPSKNNTRESLTLENSELSNYPVTFALEEDKITLSVTGKDKYPISNNRVVVDEFNVNHLETQQASSIIEINLSLTSPNFSNLKSTSTLFYLISN